MEIPISANLTAANSKECKDQDHTVLLKHLPVTRQERKNSSRHQDQGFFFGVSRGEQVSRLQKHVYRSWYSLLYSAGYRQRSGAGLINTVQGHVWQVVVVAVTLDLPWRQAVGVYVCCEDGTQTQESVGTFLHLLLSVCVRTCPS